MLTPANSTETWQVLMELRCRQEVIERWPASSLLADDLQRSLQLMLGEVQDQVRLLTNGRC